MVRGGSLHGAELDLNATPDALPALAVTACFAEGETRLVNVAQARLEGDRPHRGHGRGNCGSWVRTLKNARTGWSSASRACAARPCDGHGDHRVVMALAVAGLLRRGRRPTIDTAEAMAVTFPTSPNYVCSLMADRLGGDRRR